MLDEYPTFDFAEVDYITSDTHFSHARISELAARPFGSVAEMDAELIRRWNETVAPADVVLYLGDVALGSIADSLPLTAQLNGRKFLVPGNHDRVSPATQSRRAIGRFAPLYEQAGWIILPEIMRRHPSRHPPPRLPLPLFRRHPGLGPAQLTSPCRPWHPAAARPYPRPRERSRRSPVPRRRRRLRIRAHPVHAHRRMV